MDDPLVWGMFPLKTWMKGRIRWALGAADICFTKPLRALFFSLGQTLPIERHGAGLFQPGIDEAIQLVSDPTRAWIHIFPEGRVQQNPQQTIHYFRWGVSRIILEAAIRSDQLPYVLPIFLRGFDKIMPERESIELENQHLEQQMQMRNQSTMREQIFEHFLKQFYFFQRLPRLGCNIEAHFGHPIPDSQLASFVDVWRELYQNSKVKTSNKKTDLEKTAMKITPNDFSRSFLPSTIEDSQTARQLRSDLAALLHHHVERLRYESGLSNSPNITKSRSSFF
ncbi:hypothetical protein PMAC_003124 [Pneumocystis sp. 'macacae']|nr:hypothetical protein PMAC_003124 [Pneumocystis sp. 'macacae']